MRRICRSGANAQKVLAAAEGVLDEVTAAIMCLVAADGASCHPNSAITEDCRSDANMGSAAGDRDLEITAHPHAEFGESVAPGNAGEKREMQRRVITSGRNAHEARYGQAILLAAGGDEGVGVTRCDPGLLRFTAGIDLDKELWRPALPRHLVGKHARELWTVERLDAVEHRYSFSGLVGLQRPDQMEGDSLMRCLEGRPLSFAFLDPVLAEDTLARGDDCRDGFGTKRLADRDQGNVRGIAANPGRRLGDARLHIAKSSH